MVTVRLQGLEDLIKEAFSYLIRDNMLPLISPSRCSVQIICFFCFCRLALRDCSLFALVALRWVWPRFLVLFVSRRNANLAAGFAGRLAGDWFCFVVIVGHCSFRFYSLDT